MCYSEIMIYPLDIAGSYITAVILVISLFEIVLKRRCCELVSLGSLLTL